MKKLKIVVIALAAVCGIGGAYANSNKVQTVKYVYDDAQPNRLTDLTASELNAGFHCIDGQNVTCTYTDPNLPSARIDTGMPAYGF